jgi:RNA-directed DNA polymerase
MVETEAIEVAIPRIEDWAQTPWRKLEQHVYRLQKRIYKAQSRGNVKAVHSLQRLLMKSQAARPIAVRRVTQDNQGKRTVGIDGIKSVGPATRLTMVAKLRHPESIQARPVRRVMIPKPGKDEKRPLGIPVIMDRALQALVKLALEPQWEARFEPNSYGFRPGRSAHDAIAAIFVMIAQRDKYVLDADSKGCFDNIDQQALLNKLDTTPSIRHAIKAWLNAGVMVDGAFTPTTTGTPQGGVISPLLANIALHGMEETATRTYRRVTEGKHVSHPTLVRYADDVRRFTEE